MVTMDRNNNSGNNDIKSLILEGVSIHVNANVIFIVKT